MKRISRKLALAEELSTDVDNVEPYQPGHTEVPLFQAGDDVYAVVTERELRTLAREGRFTPCTINNPAFKAKHTFNFYKRVGA